MGGGGRLRVRRVNLSFKLIFVFYILYYSFFYVFNYFLTKIWMKCQ